MFSETKCDVCGQMYIRPRLSLYKINYKGKNYKCCSYTCYRKVQRVKEHEDPEEVLYEIQDNCCK